MLRNGEDDVSGKDGEGGSSVSGEKFNPKFQKRSTDGKRAEDAIPHNLADVEISENLKNHVAAVGWNIFKNSKGVMILEN